jgi:Flp pilus assembly pilin Flp
MDKLRTFIRDLRDDESGVVTVEWVAIAGIFVVLAVTTFLLIGDQVNMILDAVLGQMETITGNEGFPAAE